MNENRTVAFFHFSPRRTSFFLTSFNSAWILWWILAGARIHQGTDRGMAVHCLWRNIHKYFLKRFWSSNSLCAVCGTCHGVTDRERRVLLYQGEVQLLFCTPWRSSIWLNLSLGFKKNKWVFSKAYHVISQVKPVFLMCQHSILIQRTFSWLFSQAAKNVLSVPNKESASKQNEVEKFEVREQNKSKTEAKWKYKVMSLLNSATWWKAKDRELLWLCLSRENEAPTFSPQRKEK